VPDWDDLVRDRLDGLVFGADRHSEIVRELAGYLVPFVVAAPKKSTTA